MKRLRLAVLLCAFIPLAGCGSSSPYDTVPVSGKVEFADGDSFKNYAIKTIRFAPNKIDDQSRSASASIQDDGSFTLGTMTADDGAIPGKYSVGLTILKNYPPKDPRDAQLVWECQPSEVEVTSGMDAVVIKVTKPKK